MFPITREFIKFHYKTRKQGNKNDKQIKAYLNPRDNGVKEQLILWVYIVYSFWFTDKVGYGNGLKQDCGNANANAQMALRIAKLALYNF